MGEGKRRGKMKAGKSWKGLCLHQEQSSLPPRHLMDGLFLRDREGLRGQAMSLTPGSAVSQVSVPLRSKTTTNLSIYI